MNDLQKRFKDMVTMFIVNDEDVLESTIDEKIDEVRFIPTFASLTNDEVDEVRAVIKSELSIKLDKGTLIEEKGHEHLPSVKNKRSSLCYRKRYR